MANTCGGLQSGNGMVTSAIAEFLIAGRGARWPFAPFHSITRTGHWPKPSLGLATSSGSMYIHPHPGQAGLAPPLTPVGLGPTIPGSVGRCLIHWATGPLIEHFRIFYIEVTHLGGQQRMKMQVTPMMGRGGEYLSKMFRSMPLALQGTALSCTETWAAALGL